MRWRGIRLRRLWLVIVVLSVIVTGCSKNESTDKDDVNEIVVATPTPDSNLVDQEEDSKANKNINLNLNKEWSTKVTFEKEKATLTIPSYNVNVKPYRIDMNLTNVENIGQFSGFTNEQLTMLMNNGFVVLPSQDTKMHYTYDNNEYLGVPNFITADSALHIYHKFYDKSLMSVETSYLYDDLKHMSEQLLFNSIALYNVLQDEELKQLQQNNIVYFLVAAELIGASTDVTSTVDPELTEIAKQELVLIEQSSGYVQSPLLQTKLDYSQFTIRGHYTRSDELGQFFKTMIWYGIAPLSVLDDNGELMKSNTFQALLQSYVTFLEPESGQSTAAELWANIYNITSQFVGLSDDIEVFTMNKLRMSVFGDDLNPDNYNDNKYEEKLREAVKALPDPQIQGKITKVSTPTGKQFRYMGQRYVLDSFIMQELIEPYKRPIPSGLDVAGVLGSNTAESLLWNKYKPQTLWNEYEQIYRKLENEVSHYSDELWGKNLYNGWLWSIQSALTEYDANSGMPMFMTNNAWKHKSLNTALGSYTELKHDTVLYSKQAAAEMGGASETSSQHYVEPNVPLYSKLLYLTDSTISLLEDNGMLNESIRSGAELYKELLKLLINCSIKELNNEPLTEGERDDLLWYGGKMEYISNYFLQGVAGGPNDYSTIELSDMLVSDVATIVDKGNLSLGTGTFDQIYVVVPVDGKLYLSRGSVYSYYEFLSDTRLTDEQWWALHGLQKDELDYGVYLNVTEPSKDLPSQPFWVTSFKSDRNNVEIDDLEIDWEELTE
ncbi:DUF3160 domain-containing protein [Paenibacillus endoradicis]|uniref:DUF3160 domain-containing protein n=1 Tax=Paenibacillus endoradicis TaxID=2972487 RepID=UPI002158CD6A|nr:DUF3160 domain-containing protein [Paenibacillus endoradicis]MCR8657996.1 DUF3160 domain-containing protein [Paenibacillus endoradicis]